MTIDNKEVACIMTVEQYASPRLRTMCVIMSGAMTMAAGDITQMRAAATSQFKTTLCEYFTTFAG